MHSAMLMDVDGYRSVKWIVKILRKKKFLKYAYSKVGCSPTGYTNL
jgi:hypothetical protein